MTVVFIVNIALRGVDDFATKVEWMRAYRGTDKRRLSLVRIRNADRFIGGGFEVVGQSQTFWGT